MAKSQPSESDSVQQYLELEGLRTRASISATDLLALPMFEKDYRDLPMFIESCEEFLETYIDKKNPSNSINVYLIKLIKSRLAGDAKHLVSIRNCKTWPEIKRLLETHFGDQRTESNLFNELINFKTDNMQDYHAIGVEIRTLLNMTLAKCRSIVKDENELRIKENLYNKIALNSYLRNLYTLNRNVADPVRFQNPRSLEEAMHLVVEEMNWQQSCFSLQYLNNQKDQFSSPFPAHQQASSFNFGSVAQRPSPQTSKRKDFASGTYGLDSTDRPAQSGSLFGVSQPLFGASHASNAPNSTIFGTNSVQFGSVNAQIESMDASEDKSNEPISVLENLPV